MEKRILTEEQLIEEGKNWNNKQWQNNLFQNRVMDIEAFRHKCYDIVDEIKESQCSSVIHLSESDLKYIISESVNRIIQEYTDHSIFGWEHAKKKFKDGGATDEVIKKLKDAYDVYAQERISQGGIPNDTGFDLWRDEKDLKSCEQGKGMKFPNYLD